MLIIKKNKKQLSLKNQKISSWLSGQFHWIHAWGMLKEILDIIDRLDYLKFELFFSSPKNITTVHC